MDDVSFTIAEGEIFGLLLVFGLMPDINRPDPQFGGHSPLATLIAPISIAVLLGMLALNVLPTYLATYREKGILRRLSASPVHPSTLLTAQLLVQLAAAAVVVLLLVGVGTIGLGMPAPGNLIGFLISLMLGVASLFAVGLLIAAVAPSGRGNGDRDDRVLPDAGARWCLGAEGATADVHATRCRRAAARGDTELVARDLGGKLARGVATAGYGCFRGGHRGTGDEALPLGVTGT